ncbi:hypothetical protein HMPREF1549_00473 [Actinomyces johnsonii F0510]|uniref:Uncharacterized protein n=1 Tax=Actinomyces johnsonii F0510 TaxID=1227262 RepID=U1Q1B2_9ACTO|nr:hypothetical protein HMPREF1549_00473 [Actinomyces johnsonii F0510]
MQRTSTLCRRRKPRKNLRISRISAGRIDGGAAHVRCVVTEPLA